jgi:hypothetical protein
MEMLNNMMELWTGGLTVFMAVIGYIVHEKFDKIKDLDDKLNTTRVEIARDYATNSEVQRITDHIDQRFNKLEAKIDQLISR